MIINIRVPDVAVKEIAYVLRERLRCKFPDDCEMCKSIIGCECLCALRDACYNNSDTSNYVCEVTFNEE